MTRFEVMEAAATEKRGIARTLLGTKDTGTAERDTETGGLRLRVRVERPTLVPVPSPTGETPTSTSASEREDARSAIAPVLGLAAVAAAVVFGLARRLTRD